MRARARGRAGEIWRGRAERIAARYRNGEEGRLSQRWLSQKLWKFQVGTIHDLGPPNHQLAGWEMKNAAVRNNQIQLDVAPLIFINPTTPLPYFLIITIAILLEWHIPKKIYLKKPLLDQNTQSCSLTLDTTNAAQIFHLLQKVCFLCKFVRVGNSEIVGRAT